MGSSTSKACPLGSHSQLFEVHRALGKGAFGQVYSIRPLKTVKKYKQVSVEDDSTASKHKGKGKKGHFSNAGSEVGSTATSPYGSQVGSLVMSPNSSLCGSAVTSLCDTMNGSYMGSRSGTVSPSTRTRAASVSQVSQSSIRKSNGSDGRRKFFAVKVLDKQAVLGKKMGKMMMQEKNLLASIHHPLIVNLVACWQTKEDLFMMIDIMRGGDLRLPLKLEGRIKSERVRFYAFQTLLALSYLHEKRIIHRDIKPDNLLLDSAGNCHITDFNVSYVLPAGHNTVKQLSGTMNYLAPEVFDQAYGCKVDVWSLGVCVYELLTGKRPFSAKDKSAMKKLVQGTTLTYPSGMDASWVAFLKKCICPADQRYTSAEALKDPIFAKLNATDCTNKKAKTPFTPLERANIDTNADGMEQFEALHGAPKRVKRVPLKSEEQLSFASWDWVTEVIYQQLPKVNAERLCLLHGVPTTEDGIDVERILNSGSIEVSEETEETESIDEFSVNESTESLQLPVAAA
eukprot:TRINITY_DN406_c0_g2_i1.p1 TRINITY_DN406_c0_g2~~TRINITY_DN406_c0_g2_i1.p1  ORF type:complete len:564 (+),score=173.24 TRINITY_DN406_c0_g2_i1:154-1692(+)